MDELLLSVGLAVLFAAGAAIVFGTGEAATLLRLLVVLASKRSCLRSGETRFEDVAESEDCEEVAGVAASDLRSTRLRPLRRGVWISRCKTLRCRNIRKTRKIKNKKTQHKMEIKT